MLNFPQVGISILLLTILFHEDTELSQDCQINESIIMYQKIAFRYLVTDLTRNIIVFVDTLYWDYKNAKKYNSVAVCVKDNKAHSSITIFKQTLVHFNISKNTKLEVFPVSVNLSPPPL